MIALEVDGDGVELGEDDNAVVGAPVDRSKFSVNGDILLYGNTDIESVQKGKSAAMMRRFRLDFRGPVKFLFVSP